MTAGTNHHTPIPRVTVITGFLGAGKTTLVNHLLTTDHGRRIAVIVNEAGEIGIDGDLIVSSDEEIIELANGCVCCTISVRSDLTKVIKKLLARPVPPNYLLIEASGLADPAPLTQSLFVDELVDYLRLDGVVTMIDASNAQSHLEGTGRYESGNRVVDQIVTADRIVLNKVDLVTEETCARIEQHVEELNNTAPVIRTCYGRVDPDALLGIGAFDPAAPSTEPDWLVAWSGGENDPGLVPISIEAHGELDEDRLTAWLEDLTAARAPDLYRLKGIMAVDGSPDQIVLQGVHGLFETYRGGRWSGPRTSRFVLIGRDFDEEVLRSGLEGCRK